MWRRARTPICRAALSAICCAVVLCALGCQNSDVGAPASAGPAQEADQTPTTEPPAPPCEGQEPMPGLPSDYRAKGKRLVGDVDGDGTPDRVTLRADQARPLRCRYFLVAELAGARVVVARVKPLAWPGTDPELLLLAEIEGRAGLEPVVSLSPLAVYRPGGVFTVRQGELARMRVEDLFPPELVPFDDEFPAGVDCAAQPGKIVVTHGGLADEGRDDSHWDISRSFYRADGDHFELVRREEFRIRVGSGDEQRWPELGGRPFLSCPNKVS